MRNATSFATGTASVTAFALLAAALLLAGCEIPGLADAAGEPGTEFRDCAACPAMVTVPPRRTSWREPMPGAAKKRPSETISDGPSGRSWLPTASYEW